LFIVTGAGKHKLTAGPAGEESRLRGFPCPEPGFQLSFRALFASPAAQVIECRTLFCKVTHMSRVCQVTGKRPKVGNTVSHANNRKRRRFLPNLHTQRFWLESERRFVTLRVSTRGLRTIEKRGVDVVVAELRAQGEKV